MKSLAAFELVGRTLRAAALVYQEIQKGRIIGQQVQLLKVKVESAKDIQEAQSALLKQLIGDEARAVETKTFTGHTPERIERLKFSIQALAELLDRGTRIYPSLEAPKESSEVFPDMKHLNTVSSEVKQIEDNEGSVEALDVSAKE